MQTNTICYRNRSLSSKIEWNDNKEYVLRLYLLHWITSRYSQLLYTIEHTMSSWYEIVFKDFKWLKLLFFLLTSFFLLGEFQLFFIDKPSLTSEGKEDLAARNFPEILVCRIQGYDDQKLAFHNYTNGYQYTIGVSGGKKGWRGSSGNFTAKEVYQDIYSFKNIRFVFKTIIYICQND